MKKNLIISLAINGREAYVDKQKGLIETLPIAGDCDHWILNHYPPYVTPHNTTPYRFKFDLLKRAQEDGYKQVFWLDSTMRLLKDPFELLEKSESGIVAFHNIGHKVAKYISDWAVQNLCDTGYMLEDELYEIESTWGGALGFDFTKELPMKILDETLRQSTMGTFDESGSKRLDFVAARHDQSCLSVLFFFYEIPLLPYGIIAARQHVTEETYVQYGN